MDFDFGKAMLACFIQGVALGAVVVAAICLLVWLIF